MKDVFFLTCGHFAAPARALRAPGDRSTRSGRMSNTVAVGVRVALRGARTYVHVGDAVYQRWEYGVSPAGPCAVARLTAWSRQEQAVTYGRLRACEADPRRPVLVPSHDEGVFAGLPQRPAQNPDD